MHLLLLKSNVSFCLSCYLFMYEMIILPFRLSIHLPLYVTFYVSLYVSYHLSPSLSLSVSLCLCLCLSLCLSLSLCLCLSLSLTLSHPVFVNHSVTVELMGVLFYAFTEHYQNFSKGPYLKFIDMDILKQFTRKMNLNLRNLMTFQSKMTV